MDYVYSIMWLIVGLVLIFRMAKENKIFYVAGGFFLLLGGWWFVNALMPDLHLFEGIPGIVLRVITAVALILLCRVMFQERQKAKETEKKKQPSQEGRGKGEKS